MSPVGSFRKLIAVGVSIKSTYLPSVPINTLAPLFVILKESGYLVAPSKAMSLFTTMGALCIKKLFLKGI